MTRTTLIVLMALSILLSPYVPTSQAVSRQLAVSAAAPAPTAAAGAASGHAGGVPVVSAGDIAITAAGFEPAVLTVEAGETVTWHNASGKTQVLKSGDPNTIYLPLLLRNAPGAAPQAVTSALPAAPSAAPAVSFTATLAPGETFSYTFYDEGAFAFFLATAPQFRGQVQVQVQVPPDPAVVAPPLDETVYTSLADATSFLYTGPDPIQTGVAPGTIEAYRVAVLRGKVLRRDDTPLPGVAITVLDHPEFGQTLSRADGLFDLAVNGGGPITVRYTRAGYLPAQRQIDAPWEEFTWLPDVVMIPEDPNVSLIDLAAGIPMQVARGSVISDTDGIRQQTLFFPQGTTATMSFSDGMTQTITTMHVRATEYTVGPNGEKAMPAELPPNSAYTYASIFHADEAVAAGAEDVWFDPPILSYVENFIGFSVGITVPMGYYDAKRGAWIPADSGRVIKILSVTDGKADLDLDGSNAPALPAALAAMGVTDAERAKLAELYPVGQSLWRVPVPHFDRPWDQNQGTSCKEPCPEPPPIVPVPDIDDPCSQNGSIIGCETQTLGEAVELAGTPFRLHYQSDRMPGDSAGRRISIPLTGSDVSPNLKRVELSIVVAGKTERRSFLPLSNLEYTYTWDGRDGLGRVAQGKQPITVQLTYVYPLVYQAIDRFGYNSTASIMLATDAERAEFKITRTWDGHLGGWNAKGGGVGGWTLDVHHAYATGDRTLYLGNGAQRSADALNLLVINTVAGNGSEDPSTVVDGVPATKSAIGWAESVAVRPDGGYYIASDRPLDVVRLVDASGIITTAAGTGQSCSPTTDPCGDGGPATQARLTDPSDLALGPDGSLYISGDGAYRIRRVGPDGIITTVAGTGVKCTVEPCGDGAPATQAQLVDDRVEMAVGPDGSLYLSDYKRVRRVAPDGTIHNFAGGGRRPIDDVPATQTLLVPIHGLDIGPDGSLYIAQTAIGRIRLVGPDGIIKTVAGCLPCSSGGDGGPALEAYLSWPRDVDVGPDGSLFIVEGLDGYTIRQVAPDGIINTIAGVRESYGFSGDGGPALGARLGPVGLDLAPDGSLLIATASLSRVRRVAPSLPRFGQSFAIASEDGGEVYLFDRIGRHLRTLHALTGATLYEFAYDAAGRLASIADGDNNVTTIHRDGNGNPTGITGPYGQTTTFTLDANGYLASITNPAGETTGFTYTEDGLMTGMRDARGANHTFSYDALGRLTRDDDPAGGFKTLARTSAGTAYTVTVATALGQATAYAARELPTGVRRRSVTYPDGLTAETERHLDGARLLRLPDGTLQRTTQGPDPRWGMLAPVSTLVTLTTPSGLAWRAEGTRTAQVADENDPFSLTRLTLTTSVNGRTYSGVYTAATRTWVDRTPAGRAITTTIDAQGRVLTEQAAGLAPASYAYDARGRLTTATIGAGADARAATFAYDSQGYLAGITDPLARTVTLEYDAAGRVLKQTLPDGRLITFSYDANGNMTSLTPHGRPAHAFEYTPLDLTSRYIPPDVNPGADDTRYAYDLDRQPASLERPDGRTIHVGYDGAGRLDALTIARGVLDATYDPATGHLAGITAPGGLTLAFGYDGGLLKSQTWGGAIAGTTVYTHDNNLRLTAAAVNGSPIAFQYDADGLLTQAGALALSRDPRNGLLTGSTLGAITDTWRYNGFAEPIAYTAGTLFDVRYERDRMGRIITKTETIGGATSRYVYAYDPAGRLSGVTADGAALSSYTYDDNGNRLSATGPGGTVSAAYDAQDRMLSCGTNSYTYTANGELLTKTTAGQTTSYEYDEIGNLITATLPSGKQIAYLVDGQDRRVGKKVNGVLVQGFLYDDQLRPAAELDGAGSVVSRFVYATRVNVPDYMIKGGVTYRLILDHLGSPRLVANAATGEIVQRMDYDEFGRVLADTNPGFQPFGFAGGLYDRDTGLVRFGARDYDAETGRWTAKDPISFAGSNTNLYIYVAQDSVNYKDPWGMWDTKPWLPGPGFQPGHDQPSNPEHSTIVCDGRGGIKTQVNPNSGWASKECIERHEQSHKKDAERANPEVCWGKDQNTQVKTSGPVERATTEIKAFLAEIQCLKEKGANRQNPGPLTDQLLGCVSGLVYWQKELGNALNKQTSRR